MVTQQVSAWGIPPPGCATGWKCRSRHIHPFGSRPFFEDALPGSGAAAAARPPMGDRTHTLGLCPDYEWNPPLFGVEVDAPTNNTG